MNIAIKNTKVKNAAITIGKYIAVFIMLILIYNIMLFAASIIKREAISENILQSTEILKQETNFKQIKLFERTVFLDNYTDALMINLCYSIDEKTPMKSYMLARNNYIPGITQTINKDSVGELKSANKNYKLLNQVGELESTVNGEVQESHEYARYWHGYMALIRPLLLILNIQEIRIILTLAIMGLSLTLFYLIARKTKKQYAIIFAAGLISVDYFVIGFSMQECFVFIIAFIAAIIVLTNNKINIHILLFIIGSITNFMDFLTTPLITYSIPMLVYFLKEQNDRYFTVKQTLRTIIKTGIAWLLGYALTWGMKWIIVDVIYQNGIIVTAIKQVLYRSVGKSYSYIETLIRNIAIGNGIGVLASLLIPVYITCYKANCMKIEKIDYQKGLPYILIAMVPFVWYLVIRNHSYRHYYFTYRNLLVSLIGIGVATLKLIISKKKE